MQFFKSLYIHKRFFRYLAILAATFTLSYWVKPLYPIAWLLTMLVVILFFVDVYLLYNHPTAIKANRELPKKLSNSDQNPITISFNGHYPFKTFLSIIDELPEQFQERNFEYHTAINNVSAKTFTYHVRPVDRGEYVFGNLILYASSPIKLAQRRFTFQKNQMVPVYPSILQMQQYAFLAITKSLTEKGFKKIRRIGHSQEFEQIKEYITGDDIRTLNWKATAKRNQLMVNHYQDERSQPIYSLIDTGRVMKMPFNGLKLLDYAINSSLAFANVALKKNDKTGIITFSKQIETMVPALSKMTHLSTILEALYAIQTQFQDSDFGSLYAHIKHKLNQRSLLLLYTNFEHIGALRRQLPYILGISKKHVLVVIFFENSELDKIITTDTENLQSIYHKAIAKKFAMDKKLMQKELEKYGIQTILTRPEDLTVKTINKYLEIKSRGLL